MPSLLITNWFTAKWSDHYFLVLKCLLICSLAHSVYLHQRRCKREWLQPTHVTLGTWQSEIIVTHCRYLYRPTLGGGRRGRNAADNVTVTGRWTIMMRLSEAGIVLLFPAACMATAALPLRVQSAESCFTESRSNRDGRSLAAACEVLSRSSIINRFSRFGRRMWQYLTTRTLI